MHRFCPIPSDQAQSYIYFFLLPFPIRTHGQATYSPPHPCGFHSPYCLCRSHYDFSEFDGRCNYNSLAYGILEKNNFPHGILPKGVRSCILSLDGKLEVTLSGECRFPVNLGGQRFILQFASTFGGVIHAGSITEVYGVDVQVKYAWLGFNQVDRAGDQLTFHVKQFTQSFPVSGFAVSPSCT